MILHGKDLPRDSREIYHLWLPLLPYCSIQNTSLKPKLCNKLGEDDHLTYDIDGRFIVTGLGSCTRSSSTADGATSLSNHIGR